MSGPPAAWCGVAATEPRPRGTMRAPRPSPARPLAVVLAALAAGTAAPAPAQDAVATVGGLAGDARHADGPPAVARLSDPAGLAVSRKGRAYVADSANHCVRVRLPDGSLATVAGRPGEPGPGTDRLDSPSGVALDADDSLLIADTGNHVVRRLAPDGRLAVVAGLAGEAGTTNGPAASARFNAPLGLAVAPDRSVLVADSGNHSIRRIAPDGTATTLAGENGEWGALDGPAAAARFNGPVGLALAADGSLFVADSLNHAIRRVAPDGTVSTVAGRLGEDGAADGPAKDARFGKPAEIAFDPAGRLYVVDAFLHTLRRLDPDGTVRTIAGLAGVSGDANGINGTGRFLNPYGVGVLPGGSLLVTDTYNATLREVVAPFGMMLRAGAAPGTRRLEWESVVGRRYQVYATGSLGQPWQPVGTPVTATGTTAAIDDAGGASRLYQVVRLDDAP